MTENGEEQALVPTGRQTMSIEEARRAMQDFEECKAQLATADDIQKAGKKRFYKKKFWRKVGLRFNLDTAEVRSHVEREADGFPIYAQSVYRATAGNGRYADGEHECHRSERCCAAARNENCTKKSWQDHYCCKPGCSGRSHWAHPGDIPATAGTRAMNRAISNLVGGGEPSAEEIPRSAEPIDVTPGSQAIKPEVVKPVVVKKKAKGAPKAAAEVIETVPLPDDIEAPNGRPTEAQVAEFWKALKPHTEPLCEHLGLSKQSLQQLWGQMKFRAMTLEELNEIAGRLEKKDYTDFAEALVNAT